jgi:cytochrome c5
MRRPWIWGCLAALCALTSCDFMRGYAEGSSAQMKDYSAREQVGFYRLLFEDFQGLNTDTMQRSAIPWKVLGAALLIYHKIPEDQRSRQRVNLLMQERFGFYIPQGLANSPTDQPVALRYPMGLVAGTVERSLPTVKLEVTNTGCSTCHSAPLHGADGQVSGQAWVGAPSSHINLERYATEAYASLAHVSTREDELIAAIRATFPEVDEDELDSVRKYVLPPLRDRLKELDGIKRFTPYSNGGAGITNGAATLQYYMGWLGIGSYHAAQAAYTGVPTFGALRLKRSILCDGIYAAPGATEHYGPQPAPGSSTHRRDMAGMASMVTMGTLGVDAEIVPSNQGRMRDVVNFLFDRYAPPAFPGPIDAAKADAGAGIFAARCQSCHGTYAPSETPGQQWRITAFPNQLVALDDIGSDATRSKLVTDQIVDGLNDSALGEILHARRSSGYVAPPLTGLWASAPYLHNSSVPTLWHMLHPEARPVRFEVGGHKLDYALVGVAGELDGEGTWRMPAGYAPWSIPDLYDTTTPGRGNKGHEALFGGLSEDQKAQLIEHLKRL